MTLNYQIKKNRIAWLDLARAIAILCVALCHATESINSLQLETVPFWGLPRKIIVYSMFTAGRLGVPIFFFLSGYLLLDREYNADHCFKFWKKNLFPLFVTAEIWIILINFFLSWYHQAPFDFRVLLLQMLFVRNFNMGHMWYLPVILGIYLFLPLLSSVIRKYDCRVLSIPFFIAGIYLFGIPLGNLLLKGLGLGLVLAQPLDLDFLGGVYGIYLCLGYCFKRGFFKRFSVSSALCGVCAFFALAVGFQIFLYSRNVRYNIWYDSIFLLGAGISLFTLLEKADFIKIHWLIQRISICSFGIYIIHRPVQYILNRYLIPQIWHIGVIMLWISSFLLSWLIVESINKIPKAGKILFLIKDN